MMYTNIALTIILWGVYFFVHSFLIDNKIKTSILSMTNASTQMYRLIYNLIAVVGLIPIFYFLASTRSAFVIQQSEILKYFSLAICTWGIIIIKQTFKYYKLSKFLGLKREGQDVKFVKSGLHKYVRHPLYSGTILLVIGFWLYIPNILNLITVGCIFLYLVIGIKLEEKKLIREFGNDYITFRREVPSVFPDLGSLFKK